MDAHFKGLKTDIRSGLPIEHARSEREAFEEKKLESDIATGLTVEYQLNSDKGKFFIDLVTKRLENRIDELVQADPQAMTLLGFLDTLGNKIQAGRSASDRLAKTRLRREGKTQYVPPV